MRSSMSMLTSNAFSMRSAISGERAALPFIRSERVARRTPNTSAASLMLKPNSPRISSRMNSPGWGGAMPILLGVLPISGSPPGRGCRFLPASDQGQPPVSADGDTPRACPLPFELMDTPARRTGNVGHLVGCNQDGEDVAQPCHEIRAKLPAVVILNETQKASVPDVPDNHVMTRTARPYSSQRLPRCSVTVQR